MWGTIAGCAGIVAFIAVVCWAGSGNPTETRANDSVGASGGIDGGGS